jgi:hypothetical protein
LNKIALIFCAASARHHRAERSRQPSLELSGYEAALSATSWARLLKKNGSLPMTSAPARMSEGL